MFMLLPKVHFLSSSLQIKDEFFGKFITNLNRNRPPTKEKYQRFSFVGSLY